MLTIAFAMLKFGKKFKSFSEERKFSLVVTEEFSLIVWEKLTAWTGLDLRPRQRHFDEGFIKGEQSVSR